MTYQCSLKSFLLCMAVFCVFASTSGRLVNSRSWSFHYMVQQIEEIGSNSLEQHSDESVQGTATSSLSTPYKDCGSSASIKSVTVSPCDNDRRRDGVGSDICEIERGSNVTFNLSFVPKQSATQLKAVIHGIYDFVPVPFPCPQPDACHNSGIECPIEAGQSYDYQLSATVLDKYPKIKLWIKGELKDENGHDVICVKIHVQLV